MKGFIIRVYLFALLAFDKLTQKIKPKVWVGQTLKSYKYEVCVDNKIALTIETTIPHLAERSAFDLKRIYKKNRVYILCENNLVGYIPLIEKAY